MEHNLLSFEQIFIIGHGIGTIGEHFSDKQVKIAEISEEIVEISKTYFGFRGENVGIGDGLQILECEEQNHYDYIILDAFTEEGTPRHFMSRHFFRITREKLNPIGAILLNLIGRGTNDEFLKAVHSTLREEYYYTKAFSFSTEKAHDVKNILMVGCNHPINFKKGRWPVLLKSSLNMVISLRNELSPPPHSRVRPFRFFSVRNPHSLMNSQITFNW